MFQARQILDREFNNLLAMGTDRRIEEVSKTSFVFITYIWTDSDGFCLIVVGLQKLFQIYISTSCNIKNKNTVNVIY